MSEARKRADRAWLATRLRQRLAEFRRLPVNDTTLEAFKLAVMDELRAIDDEKAAEKWATLPPIEAHVDQATGEAHFKIPKAWFEID